MGYTLKIGELTVEARISEDTEGYTYFDLGVRDEERIGAPAFGEPTDFTNSRWPSYTSWGNFVRWAGLEEIFEGSRDSEISLLREHPGCFPLAPYHKEVIDRAYNFIKAKYPNAVAAMSEVVSTGPQEQEATNNANLARFEWLKYWVDWSLENCKQPAFYNS